VVEQARSPQILRKWREKCRQTKFAHEFRLNSSRLLCLDLHLPTDFACTPNLHGFQNKCDWCPKMWYKETKNKRCISFKNSCLVFLWLLGRTCCDKDSLKTWQCRFHVPRLSSAYVLSFLLCFTPAVAFQETLCSKDSNNKNFDKACNFCINASFVNNNNSWNFDTHFIWRHLTRLVSLVTQWSAVLLWRSVTIWINLLDFVKLLFLKVMQLCKPIRAAQTLRCCFERYELVRTTAKVLWHEDIALDEWSVT